MNNHRLSNLLGALSLSVADSLEQTAESTVISATVMSALISIDAHPGDTIDVLSRILRLSPSGMSRVISRLKQEGLIESHRGVDGRTVNLFSTAKGQRKVQKFLSHRQNILDRIIDVLSESEQSQLLECLEKILFSLPENQEQARNICRFCDESTCHLEGCPVNHGATKIQDNS